MAGLQAMAGAAAAAATVGSRALQRAQQLLDVVAVVRRDLHELCLERHGPASTSGVAAEVTIRYAMVPGCRAMPRMMNQRRKSGEGHDASGTLRPCGTNAMRSEP